MPIQDSTQIIRDMAHERYLLEEFTKAAMQGLVDKSDAWDDNGVEWIASLSVKIAKATLAELNKHKP